MWLFPGRATRSWLPAFLLACAVATGGCFVPLPFVGIVFGFGRPFVAGYWLVGLVPAALTTALQDVAAPVSVLARADRRRAERRRLAVSSAALTAALAGVVALLVGSDGRPDLVVACAATTLAVAWAVCAVFGAVAGGCAAGGVPLLLAVLTPVYPTELTGSLGPGAALVILTAVAGGLLTATRLGFDGRARRTRGGLVRGVNDL